MSCGGHTGKPYTGGKSHLSLLIGQAPGKCAMLQVFSVVTDMTGFVSTAAASSLAMSCWWFDYCMLSLCKHLRITICQCSFHSLLSEVAIVSLM